MTTLEEKVKEEYGNMFDGYRFVDDIRREPLGGHIKYIKEDGSVGYGILVRVEENYIKVKMDKAKFPYTVRIEGKIFFYMDHKTKYTKNDDYIRQIANYLKQFDNKN